MPNRPSIVLLIGLIALAAGFALSFFELIILGIVLLVAAAALWVRGRAAGTAQM